MSKPNRFVSPATGLIGAFQNGIARAAWLRRFRRAVMRHLPFLRLASDVHDVVYFNWLVPVSAVHGLIPPGIEIEERGGFTVLTVLTYRHGHFARPSLTGCAGCFRRRSKATGGSMCGRSTTREPNARYCSCAIFSTARSTR
jgi:hypothetical protein